jgi:hypothetical protein
MDSMQVARVWDGSLRAADWDGARAALADDATYLGLGGDDEQMTCGTADEIVGLMRSWKGKLPDVEVVNWETFGNQVLAQLRQPAWGEKADWYQVLTVRDGLITRLEDFPTRDYAARALAS